MLWDEPKIFFLERRYFFSIILSEFLKNRVALHRQTASSLCRSCFSGYDTKDARAFYANNEALMGKKKAVFLTAMADEDQKTASGANASFDLMADYLGWEIVGRLNVGGCSTADDLRKKDLTAAYELGKNL